MYMKWNSWIFGTYICQIESHEHTNCTVKQNTYEERPVHFCQCCMNVKTCCSRQSLHLVSYYKQHIVHHSVTLMTSQTAHIILHET